MIQLDPQLLLRNPPHPLLQLILEPGAASDGLSDPAPPEHHVEPKHHHLEYRVLQPAPHKPVAAF